MKPTASTSTQQQQNKQTKKLKQFLVTILKRFHWIHLPYKTDRYKSFGLNGQHPWNDTKLFSLKVSTRAISL